MTLDNVSQGLSQIAGQRQWEAVVSPNQVETVLAELDGMLWKYSKYSQNLPTPYDGLVSNPRFTGRIDEYNDVDPQYEMYNLTADPTEITNLAHAGNETALSEKVRPELQKIFDEQRALKCLQPIVNEGGTRAGGEGFVPADVPGGGARPQAEASPTV